LLVHLEEHRVERRDQRHVQAVIHTTGLSVSLPWSCTPSSRQDEVARRHDDALAVTAV